MSSVLPKKSRQIEAAAGKDPEVSSTADPILSVRNLKTYFHQDEGLVKAVDGATFEVMPGQTLGIVGESGCGKSVAARSILRIVERPGRIVDGQILLRRNGNQDGSMRTVDLAGLKADGREMRSVRGGEIGLVFQEPMTSFSPVHTVGSQIIEAIRLHLKMDRDQARQRALEMLHQVGISRADERLDEYSYQMSGGIRQRAMIAMALAASPKLLIADEPTTALDVTTQAQILHLLKRLQRETGMAMILITHDLGVIAEMADWVAVMYLGRVVEAGPVDAIFHNAKHPYTQALLDSIPDIESPSRVPLSTIAGAVPHPYDRPTGCPFHPRCRQVLAGRCDQSEPSVHEVDEAQVVSCFLYEADSDRAEALE